MDDTTSNGRPQVGNVTGNASHSGEQSAAEPDSPVSPTDWAELVARIQNGDDSAMTDLYRIFGRGLRYYLYRQLGPQEMDDKIHDTFLIVVQAIRRGDLREPERLMGFVRTVVRRQVAAHIDDVVHSRREEVDVEAGMGLPDRQRNPEQTLEFKQKVDLMKRVLGEMSAKDREILTRFYLQEQSQERICREMTLTDTQFRLLKSRAKQRFGELGTRRLQQRNFTSFFGRASSGAAH